MNLKDLSTKARVADNQRIEDFMRSGGSGSMRNSLFGRKDEAVTDEIVKEFDKNFNYDMAIEGGKWKDTNKEVIQFYVEIPDIVPVGSIEARLAKVDYNKDTHTFWALYRPKNGKWSQAKSTGKTINKK